jgi:hypothetical protein
MLGLAPEKSYRQLVEAYEERVSFTNGAHDDQTDTAAYAGIEIATSSANLSIWEKII